MTQEEVMANVEKMLQNEKQSMKTVAKVNTAAAEFDLNEGIVSVKAAPAKSSATPAGGVKPPATRASEAPTQQQMMQQAATKGVEPQP